MSEPTAHQRELMEQALLRDMVNTLAAKCRELLAGWPVGFSVVLFDFDADGNIDNLAYTVSGNRLEQIAELHREVADKLEADAAAERSPS